MNQNWLVPGFFFALLLAIFYGVFLILSPFLKALTWAAILAILFYPLYGWLLRLLHGRTTPAALIIILVITLLIVLPGIRLAGFLSTEAVQLVRSLGSLLNEEGVELWKQEPWVKALIGWWDMLGLQLAEFDFKFDWKQILVQAAQLSSGVVVSQVTGVAQNVFLFLANFIIVLFCLFFFLRDGAEFFARVKKLLPMDPDHQERLFQNIGDAVTAVVHGCIVVAIIQGFLAGLAYWLVGVPFAVVWGVATAFSALLPVGGTTLVSIPASIYLFLQGETIRGVILLAWCIGAVGTVDNVLKPLFIGNRLKLPMLLLFFGILGGLAVFGALGLILGPVLLALLTALLDVYSREYGRAEKPPASTGGT